MAITNAGATADILKGFPWCKVVFPDDLEGIKKALLELIQWKQSSVKFDKSDTDSVRKYSRESLTEKLVREFNKLADK